MPSLRSRVVLSILERRHWFQFQWRRPTVDWETSIPDLRRQVESSARRLGKLPADLEAATIQIGDRAAEWLAKAKTGADALPPGSPNPVLLYFHGGGYVMGSPRAHRGIVAKFVAASGVDALIFGYRLAPEHPFPAALDDALTAYRWLLEQGASPAQIVFVGDSAGGGLCLATLLAVRDAGLPLPAAAVALSPWTDLKCTGDSYRRRDPLAPDGSWTVYSRYYAGENDPGLPLISPLYGDLTGLPPLLIIVGERESMLDDSVGFAEKAQRAGVEVTLTVGAGMVHCYPALSPLFPEAKDAMAQIGDFIRRQTGEETLPINNPRHSEQTPQ